MHRDGKTHSHILNSNTKTQQAGLLRSVACHDDRWNRLIRIQSGFRLTDTGYVQITIWMHIT